MRGLMTTKPYKAMKRITKEHEGKRLLIKKNWSSMAPDEYEIIEVAPSGDYFKAKTPSGNAGWKEVGNYIVVEELPKPLPSMPEV